MESEKWILVVLSLRYQVYRIGIVEACDIVEAASLSSHVLVPDEVGIVVAIYHFNAATGFLDMVYSKEGIR